MKQTVYESDFIGAFKAIRPDNFSYQGLRVLFESFEVLHDDCGTEIELDVIAICCEFSEMTEDEILNDYQPEGLIESHGSFDDWRVHGDNTSDELAEYLQDNTYVCGSFVNSDGETVYIIQDF